MDSYFFVPGNKLDKIETIKKLAISEIVIDIEDAVKESERKEIFHELITNDKYKKHYIRPPFLQEKSAFKSKDLIQLLENGFSKFIFPKFNSFKDFKNIVNLTKKFNIKIILLIETPLFYIEIKKVLSKYSNLINGIALGSHDFMSEIGGKHTLKNLEVLRQEILYLARAYNINSIDIASMELLNKTMLEKEILDGFSKGYDAKFYIHPWQLDVFNNIKLYTQEDFKWAKSIEKEFNKVKNKNEFNAIKINGQVIEKPHINKMLKIINYFK